MNREINEKDTTSLTVPSNEMPAVAETEKDQLVIPKATNDILPDLVKHCGIGDGYVPSPVYVQSGSNIYHGNQAFEPATQYHIAFDPAAQDHISQLSGNIPGLQSDSEYAHNGE